MDKKKVILYGCGKRCQVILDILAESNMAVVYIIDSNSNKWGEYFGGYDELLSYNQETIEEVKGQIEADAEAYIRKSLEDTFKGNNFFKIK